jgi:DNA-binding response OmpR family regulator
LLIQTSYAIFTPDRSNEELADKRKTVVVVEDEPAAAEMFAEMMRIIGFDVFQTYSSTPAVSLITKEQPDLVLLDVMMPGVSGLEVVRYMRREPQLVHIPVIILSARSMPEDIEEGLEAGATLYLAKPVSFRDLELAIQQVLPGQAMNSDQDPTA